MNPQQTATRDFAEANERVWGPGMLASDDQESLCSYDDDETTTEGSAVSSSAASIHSVESNHTHTSNTTLTRARELLRQLQDQLQEPIERRRSSSHRWSHLFHRGRLSPPIYTIHIDGAAQEAADLLGRNTQEYQARSSSQQPGYHPGEPQLRRSIVFRSLFFSVEWEWTSTANNQTLRPSDDQFQDFVLRCPRRSMTW